MADTPETKHHKRHQNFAMVKIQLVVFWVTALQGGTTSEYEPYRAFSSACALL
jgi:hypothetical protein